MTLNSGVKLGPYEILSPLGAGGMGEVYRARDSRLGRDVAIKVLPAHLSSDLLRKQRFEREARTISSLNHPHICVLHDIGHQDGIDYLVMECVEGETLGKRLEKGSLPLEQVVKTGAEVADALDRAHRSGVVHRDLKPGNIMLTSTGAKLLDFGLAKPVVALAAAATVTVPAKDSPVTEQGTVVGTFQYMSPEQVEGREVDGRSDIFSLGTVLYEMVTGRRAFQGKSNFSVASAILEKEPEPISAIKPMTPLALDHMVRRCLAKDPEQRWQSAADIRGELQWIAESSTSGAATLPVSWRQQKRERLAWTAAGIGIVIAVLVSLAGVFFSRPASNDSIRSFVLAPENTSFVFVGNAGGPLVLSPDGKNLAFVASEGGGAQRIYLRPLGSLEAHALSGTDNAWAPFWSPDGRRLGFFADGKLRVIDIQGGAPVSLADAPTPRGGSWSPDGTIVFSPTFRSSLYRVSASGGATVAVTRVDESKHTSHRWPWFLPDGKHFLYLAIHHQAPRDENDAIYFASLDGKENIRLKAAFTNAQYASGFLLYVRDGELVAQAFDPSTGKLHEEEKQVANGVSEDGTTWRAAFTVSPNGVLAYYNGGHVDTQLAWYDRAGKQLGTLGETFGSLAASTSSAAQLRLSPAGDRAAVSIQGSTSDIWVVTDVTRGTRQRLTFGLSNVNPVWSPDGKWIAYSTRPEEGYAIARRPAAGGPEETMLSSKDVIRPADWSTDGKYLLYMKGAGGTYYEIWALPLVGERTPFQVVPSGAYTSEAPRFSPDMRWVAYWSYESGRGEVYVVPFHGGGKWQISTNGGSVPIWRNDGKELFFLNLSLVVTAIPLGGEGGQLKLGAPRALFRTSVSAYDVAPGGKKFLSFVVGDQGSKPITLVTNWTAELK